jgi:hypothetical protein
MTLVTYLKRNALLHSHRERQTQSRLQLLLRPHSLRTWDFIIFLQNVGQRPYRRDDEGVDLSVALCVVVLDVFEFGRLTEGHRVVPVQMSHPAVEVRIPTSDFGLSVELNRL